MNSLFSTLDERYGLPTAVFTICGFVAFSISLKDGFRSTNPTLMISAVLLSVGCACYHWHQRDACSVSYFGEKESFIQRLRSCPWRAIFWGLVCLAIAVLFASLAATGGHLPQ
jgi:hypothetical protein